MDNSWASVFWLPTSRISSKIVEHWATRYKYDVDFYNVRNGRKKDGGKHKIQLPCHLGGLILFRTYKESRGRNFKQRLESGQFTDAEWTDRTIDKLTCYQIFGVNLGLVISANMHFRLLDPSSHYIKFDRIMTNISGDHAASKALL